MVSQFPSPAVSRSSMGVLEFGRLSEAWAGEATDFTPLLAERLDQLGNAIGVDLASVGTTEVASAGGRRIDIVAKDAEGAEFVIENQYGKADHDHLTRGLAYAVASGAKGLVVVAEQHRDEFRKVAEYLNDVAATAEHGIQIWLVEAKAVRVDDSAWAPLFTDVVKPNQFAAAVEKAEQGNARASRTVAQFLDGVTGGSTQDALRALTAAWAERGYRFWPRDGLISLVAPGPGAGRTRAVIAAYSDGRVMVPFHSYAGTNSGIAIEELTTVEFRARANALFTLDGSKKMATTAPGWLIPERVGPVLQFCDTVAAAYQRALDTFGDGAPDAASARWAMRTTSSTPSSGWSSNSTR